MAPSRCALRKGFAKAAAARDTGKAARPARRACLRLALLVAVGLLVVYAAAATLRRGRPGEAPAEQLWAVLSPEALLADLEGNDAYLRAAEWGPGEGPGYAPLKMREVKARGVAGHAHVFGWHATSRTMCGPARATTVLHMEAVVEGVDPVFVQEVLMSPDYGLDWNPGIKDVLLRKDRFAPAVQGIPEAFYPGEGRAAPLEAAAKEPSSFHILGQVTEIPLPGPIELTYGRRFTADWAAHRFECDTKRGYTVATSSNTSQLALEAGVQTGQDLCHSSVLIAPWQGTAGHNGTVVHFISHVDPHAPTRAILPFILKGTQVTLTAMLKSVGMKARDIQRKGSHPQIHC